MPMLPGGGHALAMHSLVKADMWPAKRHASLASDIHCGRKLRGVELRRLAARPVPESQTLWSRLPMPKHYAIGSLTGE